MAPCLDCKVFMLTMARERLPALGAAKIVTGDVLGQRLPGQSKRDFALVDFHAGVEGNVVRPLSGRLLLDAGVDRGHLLDFQGRGRQRQQALAREWGWTEIPAVTSGCLLADHAYGRKYREALEQGDDLAVWELLAIGRHFRLAGRCRVVLGRNAAENDALRVWFATHRERGALCEPVGFIGPTALVLDENADALATAGRLMLRYGKNAERGEVRVTRGEGEIIAVESSEEPLPPPL
jgi:hypothetical protein